VKDLAVGANPEAVLYCDGGSRGNPGPAAAGFVLRAWGRDGPGEIIRSDGLFLGTTTNNEAEYEALILGLKAAIEEKIKRLEIRLDSQLVVRHLKGEYRVKSPTLRPLFEKARALLGSFESWNAVHIGRESNEEADALVNAILDSSIG
jgi:ribonuclease HI